MSTPPPAEGSYPLPYSTPSTSPGPEPEMTAALGTPDLPGLPPFGPPEPVEVSSGGEQPPSEQPDRTRWLAPTSAAVIAGVLGIFLAIIVTPAPTETSEYLALAAERDQLIADRDGLRDEVAAMHAGQDALVADVEQRESDADDRWAELNDHEFDLDEREIGLDTREGELDERAAGLDEREAELDSAEAEQAATTITQGVWTVGTDLQPGTYRTSDPVTGYCYWGIYRSGTNMDDIIQNDIVTGGRPSVTLSEGQDFKTSDCGAWRRQ